MIELINSKEGRRSGLMKSDLRFPVNCFDNFYSPHGLGIEHLQHELRNSESPVLLATPSIWQPMMKKCKGEKGTMLMANKDKFVRQERKPKGAKRTDSIVPGSKSISIARGTSSLPTMSFCLRMRRCQALTASAPESFRESTYVVDTELVKMQICLTLSSSSSLF